MKSSLSLQCLLLVLMGALSFACTNSGSSKKELDNEMSDEVEPDADGMHEEKAESAKAKAPAQEGKAHKGKKGAKPGAKNGAKKGAKVKKKPAPK